MGVASDRDFYIKASRSFDLVLKSIRLFEDCLKDSSRPGAPEYYRARNFLKEAEASSQELLNEAKKLLGPVPAYATKEISEWRAQLAEEAKIVAHGQELEELESELITNGFLGQWLTKEEISAYLKNAYDAQKTGSRKLANIKVRIMLDKLFALIAQSKGLQKSAQQKQNG